MQDEIADLGYIIMYAADLKRQLEAGRSPTVGYVNRLADLAAKVQRTFDPQLAEFVEESHRST